MSQQPSRYQRTFSGLIGAMIVTGLALVVFLAWRAMFSGDLDVEQPPVEWRESVKLAQSVDLAVAHPTDVPEDWTVNSVDLVATGETRWGMGMLNDDGDFIGLRQQDTSVSELVERYVDEKAEPGDEVEISSGVGEVWATWSDDGGDRGYSIEVDDEVVLVYGSASEEDFEQFISSLTL